MPGGELEDAVLGALWDLRTATIREVHTRIGEPAGLAYTTIAKVVDRLYAKGLVWRVLEGRMFRYRPAVTRAKVRKAQATSILSKILGDAPRPALVSLVDAVEAVDPKLLDELADMVAERRRGNDGS